MDPKPIGPGKPTNILLQIPWYGMQLAICGWLLAVVIFRAATSMPSLISACRTGRRRAERERVGMAARGWRERGWNRSLCE